MDSAVSGLAASNSLVKTAPDETLHVLEVAIIHPDTDASVSDAGHACVSQENSEKHRLENSVSLSVTLTSSISVLQMDPSINKVTAHEDAFSHIGTAINKNTFTKPNMPADKMQQERKLIVDMKQGGPGGSSSSDVDVENKDYKTDEDKAYESEPASLDKSDRKKLKNRTFRGKQGKTMYPRPRSNSKEMRELSRKHALLEKNLKIEGLPDPPKFRKRRLSLSSNTGRPHDKDLQFKRKRLGSVDLRPRRDHMPKWELMGGDAHDPLNLNGLAHSEEGRLLNLKTPESSPLPTPDFRKIVYVKVPPNIEDPLNLEGKHDQKVIDRLLNATIKKRHRSKKKKHEDLQQAGPSGATCTSATESVCGTDTATDLESESHCEITSKEEDSSIKKPKPIEVPTPTKSNNFNSRSRSRSLSMSPDRKFKRQLSGTKCKTGPNEPTKFPERPMFTLGNYNRYYGYRNRDHEPDPRLQYFNPTWFKDKDVLDIGCNVGHITLALAEQFHPHKILGMDIDGKLIQAARQNIRHMLSLRRKDSSKYPRVFEMTKGPLEAHPLMGSSDQFPNNVLFLQGNYVPGSEEILNLQKEEYDIILALSITKWIHLNNGDNGLKLFFQKIFRQLRPGGRLILEPQPWSTYRKRAKLSPELFAKYQSIKLKPEGFKHYLLSIGFVKCEVIGVPVTKAKGFRRPLILFTKADSKQTPSLSLNEELDYRDVCQECGSTNKSACEHPQFTGMRRGPYASHMYDHINYPTNASSDSPYLNTQRTCASFSFSNVDDGGATPMEISTTVTDRCDLMDETLDNSVSNFGSDSLRGLSVLDADSKLSSSSSSRISNISHSISGSEHSCSSSSSSGSGSTGSSTVSSSSSSCYSPNLNGPNGDVEYSPSLNGPNGVPGGYSPDLNELNGDIADVAGEDWPQESVAGFLPVPNSENVADSPVLNEPVVNIVENVWDENSDDVGVVTAGDGDGSSNEVAVLDDEEDQALPQPVANVGQLNGDHNLNVVQHWDNDNQDANIDAPVGGAHTPDLPTDISNTLVVQNTDNGL